MKNLKRWGMGIIAYLLCIGGVMSNTEASTLTAGKAHIGTFNGSTTFRTSSSNGINPGLFIEVRDAAGNLKQYTSDDGVVTVENTKEGAYVTQAKLLGKTKYVDQETGEVLDQWEAGRNLKLESSKMPVLTTTGKNLTSQRFGTYTVSNEITVNSKENEIALSGTTRDHRSFDVTTGDHVGNYNDQKPHYKDRRLVQKSGTYTLSYTLGCDNIHEAYPLGGHILSVGVVYDDNTIANYGFALNGNDPDYKAFTHKIEVDSHINGIFIQKWYPGKCDGLKIKNLQLEENSTQTKYEPYKSNILTVNEDVELRGIGDVKDELNLLTGELTERVVEIVLDGSEDWIAENVRFKLYRDDIIPNKWSNGLSNHFIGNRGQLITGAEYDNYFAVNGYGSYLFVRDIDLFPTPKTQINEFKTWLNERNIQGNPVILQYASTTESVKTVDLTSTHQFDVISDAVVQVKGDVLPTIYSVTVPSEPLTFAINPNGEEGQQFIAPDFKITNESKGPVFLELKSFQQVTNVFNDVSPDKYENWSYLTKDESRDIALALVPMKSEGWLTLNEGLKYVSTTENIELGSIKPGGTVDFSFSAYHGRVFDQNLFPEYRLVFTFGF